MLHQLSEYADSVGLVSEPGFSAKRVHWAINVTSEGRFLAVEDLRDGTKGRKFKQCPDLSQPELIGGGGVRSQFLAESVALLTGLLQKPISDAKKLERYQAKRGFFIDLIDQVSQEVQEASWLHAAARFLGSTEDVARARAECEGLKAKPTDTVVVVVEEENPLESTTWHAWWRSWRQKLKAKLESDSVGGYRRRDLLSGELVEPLSTHPKIKGLAGIGGLGTGDSLISFDKLAFQSYGLEQSQNASLSEESAVRYASALNHLLEHGEKLADTKICYWYSEETETDDLFSILLDPRDVEDHRSSKVIVLLRALSKGTRPDGFSDRFHYFILSGCSGRVMIRDWCEGELSSLQAAVRSWFEDLSIVALDGINLAPARTFYAVLASLFRDPSKELPSPFAQDLFRRAVNAKPLPARIVPLALNRLKSDIVSDQTSFNTARMGLLKAYLNRKNGDQTVNPYLNHEHPDPAYHCGRLLAVLARLQQAALGDVGAGVVQRFYSATSQAPALTLGRMLANAQNHLAKLGGGLAHLFDTEIASIVARVDSRFPQTLDLERQSLFALGYYQQLAEMARIASERKAQKLKDKIEESN